MPAEHVPRQATRAEAAAFTPVYVVWELTTRCDQPCQHCGTRAGSARESELSTREVLVVGAELAGLGCREVTLIGGEAYLRPDIVEVIGGLSALGLRVTMQSGGRALTAERLAKLVGAGLVAVGISVDGLEVAHDTLRGNKGSFEAAMRALGHIRDAGLPVSANTQINRLSQGDLVPLSRILREKGVKNWQVQLTVPMGNAADHPDWILEPSAIVPVIDTLAMIQRDALENPLPDERGIKNAFVIHPANNVGYYGPHESLLRSRPGGQQRFFEGCGAGKTVLGIESDGSIKGCPSLPTVPYVSGNVRTTPLSELWARNIGFPRESRVGELWGFCAGCYYAELCQGGCSFTTHTAFGRRGNNPWCYHRVTQLKQRGIREVLRHVSLAAGERYDYGRFEIVEVPLELSSGRDQSPDLAGSGIENDGGTLLKGCP